MCRCSPTELCPISGDADQCFCHFFRWRILTQDNVRSKTTLGVAISVDTAKGLLDNMLLLGPNLPSRHETEAYWHHQPHVISLTHVARHMPVSTRDVDLVMGAKLST